MVWGVPRLGSGLECSPFCPGFYRANGFVGQEEGKEVSQGIWIEVQEEAVHHAAWNLVACHAVTKGMDCTDIHAKEGGV